MNAKTGKTPMLVILGIGKDDKPHAASFAIADELTVRKAAQAMAMRVGRANDEKSIALVQRLTKGRLFATGKALVPLVKASLYDELLKSLSIDATSSVGTAADTSGGAPNNGDKRPPASTSNQPASMDPWDTIKIGSVVLAQDAGEDHGWWEAVVTSIGSDGETLTVRWRDYRKLPQEKFKRREVSILAPTVRYNRRPR